MNTSTFEFTAPDPAPGALMVRFSDTQLTAAQQEAVALRRRINELERQVAGLQAALADASAACERAMLGRARQETL